MTQCYNFSWPLAILVAAAGVVTSFCCALNPLWFDLKQQRVHTFLIEHDASLCESPFLLLLLLDPIYNICAQPGKTIH